MILNISELKTKYPELINEIDKISEVYNATTTHFASIIAKGELSEKDMFSQSVLNRTNQCLFASTHCLVEDLPFPLINIVRQLIEIYAVNQYVLSDSSNFQKALSGKHKHENPNLQIPNIITLVQKIKEKDILRLYNEYSEVAHPNSRSVFMPFKGREEKGEFYSTITSYNRKIESETAYHLIRNIAGLANRINISTKKLNPLKKYITLAEFKEKHTKS